LPRGETRDLVPETWTRDVIVSSLDLDSQREEDAADCPPETRIALWRGARLRRWSLRQPVGCVWTS